MGSTVREPSDFRSYSNWPLGDDCTRLAVRGGDVVTSAAWRASSKIHCPSSRVRSRLAMMRTWLPSESLSHRTWFGRLSIQRNLPDPGYQAIR